MIPASTSMAAISRKSITSSEISNRIRSAPSAASNIPNFLELVPVVFLIVILVLPEKTCAAVQGYFCEKNRKRDG